MGEGQARSIHGACCRFLPEGVGVVLCPNPLFLLEIFQTPIYNSPLSLECLSYDGDGPDLLRSLLFPFGAFRPTLGMNQWGS